MTPDEHRHVLGAAMSIREAAAWLTVASRLFRAVGVTSTVLPDLAVWLADLAHDIDPTDQRVPPPEEESRAPITPTQ